MSSSLVQTRNSSTNVCPSSKDSSQAGVCRHLQWPLLHQRGCICWPSHRCQPPGMHCPRSTAFALSTLLTSLAVRWDILTSDDFFICIVAQAVVSQAIFYRSTSVSVQAKHEGWLSMALRLMSWSTTMRLKSTGRLAETSKARPFLIFRHLLSWLLAHFPDATVSFQGVYSQEVDLQHSAGRILIPQAPPPSWWITRSSSSSTECYPNNKQYANS